MIDHNSFLVSHPTGNTFVRALLKKLLDKNLLAHFYTTIGFGKDCGPLFSCINKYRLYDIPDTRISRMWYPEFLRLLLRGNHEKNRRLTDQSYFKLDLQVAKKIKQQPIKFIHAYEDGAFASFLEGKELGIQCSYELPIAHWATCRRLLSEEADRYPEWEPTLESTREPEEKLFRKEEELRLADRITCPSRFVLESIPKNIRKNKLCQISPFGSPVFEFSDFTSDRKTRQPFRLLFVGSMSQRKGLADIFEAMKLLKDVRVHLSILGQPSMPMEFYRKQYSNFEYFRPCSHYKIRNIMKMHDALVLPSIVEGRALVQQEALACGLPLIVTPNAGGQDLITEGLTGYIVPIRAPEKIAEKIMALVESKIPRDEQKKQCEIKASSYSWSDYAQKIIDLNFMLN